MVDGQTNPSERALRARLAAKAMHGRHDARQTTAKARAAFPASFERQADPEGQLPPPSWAMALRPHTTRSPTASFRSST
jgi:hypothetical protein